MTFGTVKRPSASEQLATIRKLRGGGGFIPYRSKWRVKGEGCAKGRVGKKRGGVQIKWNKKFGQGGQYGEGFDDALRFALPYLRKIPEFFRSALGRKIVGKVAKTGATAGLQIAADKLEKKIPLKKAAETRGKAAAIELVQAAQEGLKKQTTTGSGRRSGTCRGKSINRGKKRGGRAVTRKTTRVQRRRKPDIFDKKKKN